MEGRGERVEGMENEGKTRGTQDRFNSVAGQVVPLLL